MLIPLAALFGLAGCQPDVPVKEQDARRLNEIKRCLAAVVFPQGGRSDKIWVFNVIGPEYPVDRFKPAFEDFILRGGISINDRKEVVWKLPDGWKQEKGAKNSEKLLVSVNDLKEPLEIVVHQRTMRKQIADRPVDKAHAKNVDLDMDDFMRYDVERRTNNWRRELGLANQPEVVSYFYERRRLGKEAFVYLVNMTGPGHEALGFTELQFDLPRGWEEIIPRAAAPGMSPAALAIRIQEDDQKAYFTLTTGIGGGIPMNVNRWHLQVNKGNPKAKELEENEINALLETIDVAGKQGKFVDLKGASMDEDAAGKHSAKDNRTLGVILTLGGEMWFFKLTGPSDLVGRHRENFRNFVKNFAFAE